jgi:hypothetical protein
VINAGVGEQQRQLDVHQLFKRTDVRWLHPVPGDHKHVIAQAASVKIPQHGQGVWSDTRQEWIGRPVEDLQRSDVCPEVPVCHELLDGLSVRHQGARRALVP